MKALVAAVLFAAAPTAAFAGAFDVLSWKPDRLAAVERDSVVDADGMKRARITVIFAQPRTDRAQPYRGLVGLQEFDCAGARYRTLQSTPFDDSGAMLAAATIREPSAWVSITPGTLGNDEKRRVCDGEWSARTYTTALPVLMAAYLLRPDAAEVRTAQAPAASENAAEASAAAKP